MGTNVNAQQKQQPLTTVGGNFHVGMTAQKAKDKNLYEGSIFKTGFTDIDENGDGVLSAKEICNQRDKQCSSKRTVAYFGMVAGGAQIALGVTTSEIGIGLPVAAVGTAVVAEEKHNLDEAEKEQKITDQYRKEHPQEFGV